MFQFSRLVYTVTFVFCNAECGPDEELVLDTELLSSLLDSTKLTKVFSTGYCFLNPSITWIVNGYEIKHLVYFLCLTCFHSKLIELRYSLNEKGKGWHVIRSNHVILVQIKILNIPFCSAKRGRQKWKIPTTNFWLVNFIAIPCWMKEIVRKLTYPTLQYCLTV